MGRRGDASAPSARVCALRSSIGGEDEVRCRSRYCGSRKADPPLNVRPGRLVAAQRAHGKWAARLRRPVLLRLRHPSSAAGERATARSWLGARSQHSAGSAAGNSAWRTPAPREGSSTAMLASSGGPALGLQVGRDVSGRHPGVVIQRQGRSPGRLAVKQRPANSEIRSTGRQRPSVRLTGPTVPGHR